MSHINMTGINAGGSALGGMSLINNGTNGATPRAGSDQGDNDFEARLNTHIYDYFLKTENYECARALLNSHIPMEPQIRRRDGEINGTDDPMHTDSKDDIDSKRPDDLPGLSDNSNFLLEWYSTFWDFFFARTKNVRATPQALQYMQVTQQNRLRAEQHHQMLRQTPGMIPAGMNNYEQMMRYQQANGMQINGDLRQKALQNNNRNAFGQATPHQMAQMKQSHQMMQQQQMRRDPSDLDINGQRPRTPSSGDNNAPSPSKRPRLDGVPMNGPQMIPNGRGPPQGLQGQNLIENPNMSANVLLLNHGINPSQLSPQQIQSFNQQHPHVQEKSIQVYAQNMRQSQQRQSQSKPGMPGQGSPMMHQGMEIGAGDFFGVNPQMQMRGGPAANTTGGNHALQDYQMQLMLLEQQNKKRLLMARQEQDNTSRPEGQSGNPGAQGFAPGMSPSGSRSGPSPGPSDQMKRGTPKMGSANLPGGGSPMPDGTMSRPGGSPAAMPYNNQMPPEMFQQMKLNEGMGTGPPMRPPSSHPQFNGQPFAPQQHAEAMRRSQAGQITNGGWVPGPPVQTPMMQPSSQTQQQPSIGTPQQRSMPPPTAPAGTTTNGRPTSPAQPAAPPTPSQSAKPNPKAKKDGKESRKRPAKSKTSNAGAGANPTPATDAENPPQTPAPNTPITPMAASSFSQPTKNEGQTQASLMQGVTSSSNTAPLPQAQPDTSNIQQFSTLDAPDGDYAMPFTTDLNGDVLENFDFDSFLQGTAGEEFTFDATTLGAFGTTDGVEAGAGDA